MSMLRACTNKHMHAHTNAVLAVKAWSLLLQGLFVPDLQLCIAHIFTGGFDVLVPLIEEFRQVRDRRSHL